MPRPTPFHPRIEPLVASRQWKQWAGFFAVIRYDYCHEPEYYAFRHSAGLIDVTPLYKYRVQGQGAEAFLDRVVTRNIRRCKVGQVSYTCWCDSGGHVLDDGTVQRLASDDFRLTAAEPNLRWLELCARDFDVTIRDETDDVAAVAIQGPTSRAVLKDALTGIDLDGLRFFRLAHGHAGDVPVMVSRTGYTGDLGYEVWVDRDRAVDVWDALMEAGRPHGILPAGMLALDMVRVEAGLVMLDVDYTSARNALVDAQKSTPAELGLGWTVSFKKGDFIGRAALEREKEAGGPAQTMVGLEIDWDELKALYDRIRLPVQVSAEAWRRVVPIFRAGRQVGYASSGTWSPILKKDVALATVDRGLAEPGTRLQVETTVLFDRRRVGARVTKTPFYDPPHKRS